MAIMKKCQKVMKSNGLPLTKPPNGQRWKHEKQWQWCTYRYTKPPLKWHNFLKFMYFGAQGQPWKTTKKWGKAMGGPCQSNPMVKGENMKSNGSDVHTDTPSHHWNDITFWNLCTLVPKANHEKQPKSEEKQWVAHAKATQWSKVKTWKAMAVMSIPIHQATQLKPHKFLKFMYFYAQWQSCKNMKRLVWQCPTPYTTDKHV